jgi:hypothetical protein
MIPPCCCYRRLISTPTWSHERQHEPLNPRGPNAGGSWSAWPGRGCRQPKMRKVLVAVGAGDDFLRLRAWRFLSGRLLPHMLPRGPLFRLTPRRSFGKPLFQWCRREESNLRAADYESASHRFLKSLSSRSVRMSDPMSLCSIALYLDHLLTRDNILSHRLPISARTQHGHENAMTDLLTDRQRARLTELESPAQ